MSDYFYTHRFKVLTAIVLITVLQILTYLGVHYYQTIAQEHRYNEYAKSINSQVEQAIKEKQQTTIAISGVCQGSCRLVSKSTQPDFLYQG